MKIVLLGYMASGKSAIAKKLSEILDVYTIDLDAYIEEKEQTTISEIFNKKGEIYFRNQEQFYLKELLESNNSCIIAVGGGTPCYGNNIELIRENSISFYLRASIATLLNRLEKEKSERPLVATIATENLREFIAKHLFERSPYYDKAHYIIDCNDKTIDAISNEIKNSLV